MPKTPPLPCVATSRDMPVTSPGSASSGAMPMTPVSRAVTEHVPGATAKSLARPSLTPLASGAVLTAPSTRRWPSQVLERRPEQAVPAPAVPEAAAGELLGEGEPGERATAGGDAAGPGRFRGGAKARARKPPVRPEDIEMNAVLTYYAERAHGPLSDAEESQLSACTSVQLQRLCQELGRTAGGTKAACLTRLSEHFKNASSVLCEHEWRWAGNKWCVAALQAVPSHTR